MKSTKLKLKCFLAPWCLLTYTGVKNEGWFDPWLLLSAFKKKLMSMGVKFLEAEVTGVNVEQNRVNKVKVTTDQKKVLIVVVVVVVLKLTL